MVSEDEQQHAGENDVSANRRPVADQQAEHLEQYVHRWPTLRASLDGCVTLAHDSGSLPRRRWVCHGNSDVKQLHVATEVRRERLDVVGVGCDDVVAVIG